MNDVRAAGILEGMALRVQRFTGEVHELAHKLEEHAQAVHGPIQEAGNGVVKSTDIEQPVGLLPTLRQELDSLEQAISRIAHAAGLNTTLN